MSDAAPLASADPGARARAALDAAGDAYEVIEVDPELADTAAFSEHYGYPLEVSGNTILVASKRGERRFCACVVLANTRLDVNHAVRPLLETWSNARRRSPRPRRPRSSPGCSSAVSRRSACPTASRSTSTGA